MKRKYRQDVRGELAENLEKLGVYLSNQCLCVVTVNAHTVRWRTSIFLRYCALYLMLKPLQYPLISVHQSEGQTVNTFSFL